MLRRGDERSFVIQESIKLSLGRPAQIDTVLAEDVTEYLLERRQGNVAGSLCGRNRPMEILAELHDAGVDVFKKKGYALM